MQYIRLLKSPPARVQLGHLFPLTWTIQTDLSDCHCHDPHRVELLATTLDGEPYDGLVVCNANGRPIKRGDALDYNFGATGGFCRVEVRFTGRPPGGGAKAKILVRLVSGPAEEGSLGQFIGNEELVLPVWSAPVMLVDPPKVARGGKRAQSSSGKGAEPGRLQQCERRFPIPLGVGGGTIGVMEDSGERTLPFSCATISTRLKHDRPHGSILQKTQSFSNSASTPHHFLSYVSAPTCVSEPPLRTPGSGTGLSAQPPSLSGLGSAPILIRELDWTQIVSVRDTLPARIDLVIMSDVVYNAAMHLPLLETMWSVCDDMTRVLCAYKERHVDEGWFWREARRTWIVEMVCEGGGCSVFELKKRAEKEVGKGGKEWQRGYSQLPNSVSARMSRPTRTDRVENVTSVGHFALLLPLWHTDRNPPYHLSPHPEPTFPRHTPTEWKRYISRTQGDIRLLASYTPPLLLRSSSSWSSARVGHKDLGKGNRSLLRVQNADLVRKQTRTQTNQATRTRPPSLFSQNGFPSTLFGSISEEMGRVMGRQGSQILRKKSTISSKLFTISRTRDITYTPCSATERVRFPPFQYRYHARSDDIICVNSASPRIDLFVSRQFNPPTTGAAVILKYVTYLNRAIPHIVNIAARYHMEEVWDLFRGEEREVIDAGVGISRFGVVIRFCCFLFTHIEMYCTHPQRHVEWKAKGHNGKDVRLKVSRRDVEAYAGWDMTFASSPSQLQFSLATASQTLYVLFPLHSFSFPSPLPSHPIPYLQQQTSVHNAASFANSIPTHTLQLLPGADHSFAQPAHASALADAIAKYFSRAGEKDRAWRQGTGRSVQIPRWISVEGYRNFRDLGGWPVKGWDGATVGYVRERLVFRGGE
ncbi:hypothetical protein BC938DRAFT_473334 [Jimgerdemannia flammicorona]|uniref:Methyltransferase-domain-containing protein n=1 Tax=Jimgerdemannia flammicorona TaxID=994334 RepID=A0A433Q4D9_9FUNG|nr:hypothetical protein BC938DRAFT_473334 [Jimgerdemannia flammicorona]